MVLPAEASLFNHIAISPQTGAVHGLQHFQYLAVGSGMVAEDFTEVPVRRAVNQLQFGPVPFGIDFAVFPNDGQPACRTDLHYNSQHRRSLEIAVTFFGRDDPSEPTPNGIPASPSSQVLRRGGQEGRKFIGMERARHGHFKTYPPQYIT